MIKSDFFNDSRGLTGLGYRKKRKVFGRSKIIAGLALDPVRLVKSSSSKIRK